MAGNTLETGRKFTPDNPYKVMVIGQDRFGADVFRAATAMEGVAVPAVVTPRSETEPVRLAANEMGVETYPLLSLDDPHFPNEIERLKIDLIAMAFVNKIIKNADIFTTPPDKTVQYHPSLLSIARWRGRSAINEAIINGDEETGFAIFYPDGGIDTGRVLLERKFAIKPDDNVASLYIRDLAPNGVRSMVEAIKMSMKGGAYDLAKPQDESNVTMARWIHKSDAIAQWDDDKVTADRKFRGLSSPGIWTRIKPDEASDLSNPAFLEHPLMPGKIVNLLKTKPYPGTYRDKPGTIVEITDADFVVTLGDGSAMSAASLQDSILEQQGKFLEEISVKERGPRLTPIEHATLHTLKPGMNFIIPQVT